MVHDRLAPSTGHLTTPHTCWTDIYCRGILWFLRYLLASPLWVRTLSHLVPLRHVSYVLFERSSLICLSVSFFSLILNFIALPPRLRAQAPPAVPMLPMKKLIMHRHVPIGLFRFHLPTLADTILRFWRHIPMVHHLRCILARTRVRRWCQC